MTADKKLQLDVEDSATKICTQKCNARLQEHKEKFVHASYFEGMNGSLDFQQAARSYVLVWVFICWYYFAQKIEPAFLHDKRHVFLDDDLPTRMIKQPLIDNNCAETTVETF